MRRDQRLGNVSGPVRPGRAKAGCGGAGVPVELEGPGGGGARSKPARGPHRGALAGDNADGPAVTYLPPQHTLASTGGQLLSAPAAGDPLGVALQYLAAHAAELGVSVQDLRDPIVTNQYTDADSGQTHIYLAQRINDLPVVN